MALAQVPRRVMEIDLDRSIEKQLKQVGVRVPQKQVAEWQRSADAILHLARTGVLHESVVVSVRSRLRAVIRSYLQEM